MPTIITYGTFDLLHYGHIRLLKRAANLGDYLIVGLSTDKFNAVKDKKAHQDWKLRKKVLLSLPFVDKVIPERDWMQKYGDIKKYKPYALVMGDDWAGRFDHLPVKIVYLTRTKGISSTEVRDLL